MQKLRDKKILLGICGGIAAYKAILLLRELRNAGADVQVVLTPDAHAFVTPLTLSALSGKPVLTSMFDEESGSWNNHVALAEWADLFIVAPLTINSLAKMVHGLCDNLLMACYFSARCPVWVAPAMDLEMHDHWVVQENLRQLKQNSVHVIPPVAGALASGLHGFGRMEEPGAIFEFICSAFSGLEDLKGKRILINAGPTREYLDPVRYLSNESTGKMGMAIVKECISRGARVALVNGPLQTSIPIGLDEHIEVISASEMAEACKKTFSSCDAAILTAAVADYRPEFMVNEKIKKTNDSSAMTLKMVRNEDILYALGTVKSQNQILIGFALETSNGIEHAKEKRTRKHADLIVLNSLNDDGAGFGFDTNKVTFVDREGEEAHPLLSKNEVARLIVNKLVSLLK